MADPQQEGFVRQRRNLMIASLVLLFSEASDLKVAKIAAFGTDLLVGKPENVTTALWVATGYWLIRYYQYARSQYADALEAAIYSRITTIGETVATSMLLRDRPRLAAEAPQNVNEGKRLARLAAKLTHPETPQPILRGVPEESVEFGSPTWVRRSPKLVEVIYDVTLKDNQYGGQKQHVIRIEGAQLVWLRLRAWSHLSLHTTLFTELILPYIVFLLPVAYLIRERIG